GVERVGLLPCLVYPVAHAAAASAQVHHGEDQEQRGDHRAEKDQKPHVAPPRPLARNGTPPTTPGEPASREPVAPDRRGRPSPGRTTRRTLSSRSCWMLMGGPV